MGEICGGGMVDGSGGRMRPNGGRSFFMNGR